MQGTDYQRLSREELLALVAEQDAQISRLLERLAEQDRRITALEAELARARKDSSNSSKPPSSDIVKPPRPPGSPRTRAPGAQPGHPRHERAPFPEDQVDRRVEHFPRRCPDCGGRTRPEPEPACILQQVELLPRPYEVVSHRAWDCRCVRCKRK